MDDLQKIANGVATLGEQAQHVEGRLVVLACAMQAFMQTHPDHEAFAKAFRRSWLLVGSQHSNSECGSQTHEGIDQVLAILEGACSVSLNVRPPRSV
jgi:hypothetical protein